MSEQLCRWCGIRPVKFFRSGRTLTICNVCYSRRRKQLYYQKKYGKDMMTEHEKQRMCKKCGIRPAGYASTSFSPYCLPCYLQMIRKKRAETSSWYSAPANYFHFYIEDPERRKAFLKQYNKIRRSMKLCKQKGKDFDTVSCVWMDNVLAEYEDKLDSK